MPMIRSLALPVLPQLSWISCGLSALQLRHPFLLRLFGETNLSRALSIPYVILRPCQCTSCSVSSRVLCSSRGTTETPPQGSRGGGGMVGTCFWPISRSWHEAYLITQDATANPTRLQHVEGLPPPPVPTRLGRRQFVRQTCPELLSASAWSCIKSQPHKRTGSGIVRGLFCPLVL